MSSDFLVLLYVVLAAATQIHVVVASVVPAVHVADYYGGHVIAVFIDLADDVVIVVDDVVVIVVDVVAVAVVFAIITCHWEFHRGWYYCNKCFIYAG